MTAMVTEATTKMLLSSTYDALSTTVGLAAIAALVCLLVQREVIRIVAPSRAERSGWAFDIAIVPLLVVFVLIVTARLASLVA